MRKAADWSNSSENLSLSHDIMRKGGDRATNLGNCLHHSSEGKTNEIVLCSATYDLNDYYCKLGQ